MVPSLFSRLHRRKPLDLVASELADLQQRSETAAAEGKAAARRSHGPIASGGWLAPTDTVYELLDLPAISVKRGGIDYPKRSIDELKMEKVTS